MSQVSVPNISLNLRADGHLVNLDDWSTDVAEYLAEKDGLTLNSAHWEIINLLREYYKQFNISPIRKLLFREISEQLGESKAEPQYLAHLFPKDVMEQGIRIAGVPIPLLDKELSPRLYIRSSPPFRQEHYIQEFVFRGRAIQVYPMGNLVNQDDWDHQLAEHLAQREGLQLSPEHWEVLDFLRDFYVQFGITPMVKLMIKHMRTQHGEIKSSRDYLYKLFPGGPARQGSRIAGLPEPQGCIDP